MRLIARIAAVVLAGSMFSACAGVPAPRTTEAVQGSPWLSLPPTPTLPAPDRHGRIDVEGARLWYAEFGVRNGGMPVLLLHGGLANSNYFGALIPTLTSAGYYVIALDTRGHGRSTTSTLPYSYALLAEDVIALLDELQVDKVDIVGWSDGGTVGYQLGLAAPARVNRLLAFGANATLDGLKEGYGLTPTFQAYIARAEVEYRALSPNPGDFAAFLDAISAMWASETVQSVPMLSAITFPVTVMIAEHDEALKMTHVEAIAEAIPNADLVVLPNVSHFALIQAPEQFDKAVVLILENSEG